MAGRLFIADFTGAELYEIDPDGADTQGTRLRALPTGLTVPTGMTVYEGRLLITDNDGDELFEIDPDGADTQGTRLRALPTGLTTATGMTVYEGRLLITDNDGDELFEIDPDGADTQGTLLRDLPSGLTAPVSMTNFDGRLFIADIVGAELYEIDPDGASTEGTRLRALPTGLTTATGMTVYEGRLLITDNTNDELFEIDPDGADTQGTLLRDLPSGLTSPQSMAWLPPPAAHTVNAGAATWSFSTPQAAVTHTARPLEFADFNDTGLQVEAAALLTASAPGTSGNNFYADSSRGGSDAPIEGELGVGTGETLISRMRRASTENLTLNDNDLPVALDFGAFFGTSGEGNDLTVYLQTTSDGLVSFTVASAFLSAGGGWLNLTLPAAGRTLLDNLATGDRFIFALARTSPVAVDHTVDAGPATWSFATPQAAVTHTPAATHTVNAGSASWSFATPESAVTHTPAATHAVDAGAATWSFTIPQAAVTHTPAAVHTVNAGAATWSFSTPQTTITHTPAATHAVDAGAATWSFSTPQASVTHTTPSTHTVNAGAATWSFSTPQASVTHTVPILEFADFDSARLQVEAAALLTASAPGTSGNNFYADSSRGGSDTPIEGELGVGTGETLISRMRRASTTNLTLNDNDLPVALGFDTFFGTGGDGADLTAYLQTTADGVVSFTVASAFLSAGGNWLNLTLPAAGRTLLDNLATGDRFIFALARTSPVAVDHTVDAGPASWSFATPQAAVTHTPAAVHAVNAGAASWSFSIPQAAVTHTPAAIHSVNAGAATWSFATPHTTVTLTQPGEHTANAGAATWSFATTQATVTHTPAATHTVNAGAATWSFATPQAAVTHTTPGTHAVNAGAATWSFTTPHTAISHFVHHRVNAGAATWHFSTTSSPPPLYQILVDWDNDNVFEPRDLTVSQSHPGYNRSLDDIYPDLLAQGVRFSRGRTFGGQIFGRSMAGELTATLKNSDQKYTPDATDSVLPPNHSPHGVKVQVVVTPDDPDASNFQTPTIAWTGYLDELRYADERGGRDRVTLIAYGLISRLNTPVRAGPLTSSTTGAPTETDPYIPENTTTTNTTGHAAAIIVSKLLPNEDTSYLTGEKQLVRWWVDERPAIVALRELEETEQTVMYERKDGALALPPRSVRTTGTRVITSQASFRDTVTTIGTDPKHIRAVRISPHSNIERLANIVTVPVRRYTVAGQKTTLWMYTEDSELPAFLSIPANDSLTFIIDYPNNTVESEDGGFDLFFLC